MDYYELNVKFAPIPIRAKHTLVYYICVSVLRAISAFIAEMTESSG
jgi:hypothetical protein